MSVYGIYVFNKPISKRCGRPFHQFFIKKDGFFYPTGIYSSQKSKNVKVDESGNKFPIRDEQVEYIKKFPPFNHLPSNNPPTSFTYIGRKINL